MQINVVLCPVDFSPLASGELELATQTCEAFGARLVLHYNIPAISPGYSKAWEWQREHRQLEPSMEESQRQLNELLKQLPGGIRAEGIITHGPLGTVVPALAQQIGVDLLVLGTHGWSTEDHASLSERIIDEAPCPVLTIHEPGAPRVFRSKTEPGGAPPCVVVPTDFSAAADKAVAYAMALASKVPLRITLLHVSRTENAGAALETLDALVPPDLRERVECHLRAGRADEEIEKFLHEKEPKLVVMGTHGRRFWHRLWKRDVARELLHGATCPVCFVPPTTVC